MASPPRRPGYSGSARSAGALDAPMFPDAAAGAALGDGDGARAGLVANRPAGDNAPPLSVSEISAAVKRTVEDRFGRVRVRGELSGVKRAASGHLYAALKDDAAVIDAVMWKGGAQRLAFRPEDGVEVIATGRLTTYPGRSKYQLIIETMEVAGEGALLAMLEKLRQRLAAEGLFARERKVGLPPLPRVIGVVTSPNGAVIRDIWHRVQDRFPTRVLLWPVIVQGEGAAGQIAAAVRGFDALPADGSGAVPRPDVVIVARGGGSIEDLWAFNEEAVVRAIAASSIPVISAVGHETDTTLADHAADVRAPTPTAAAELAVPVRTELIATVTDLGTRLVRAGRRRVALGQERVAARARLPRRERLYEPQRQRLDDAAERVGRARGRLAQGPRRALAGLTDRLGAKLLEAGVRRGRERLGLLARPLADHARLLRPARERQLRAGEQLSTLAQRLRERARERLALRTGGLSPATARRRVERGRALLTATARLIDGLDPRRLLSVGYAMVTDRGGRVLTSAAAAGDVGAVTLRFADGAVDAQVGDSLAPAPAPAPRRHQRAGPAAGSDQGALF